MTETATSPRFHAHSRSSRTTTTPAARPPTHNPGSVGQNMPPLLSTPYNHSIPAAKTPSPNYFGFQGGEDASLTDSPQHAKNNWSPPSSTVRSTAAASPSYVPLDQNPDFDAFRRQSEGKAFNLGGLGSNFKMTAPPTRPEHRRATSRPEQSKDVRQYAHSKTLE